MENCLKINFMNFTKDEYRLRLKKVQQMMQEKGIELLISHDTKSEFNKLKKNNNLIFENL